jgi:hypothetical protein
MSGWTKRLTNHGRDVEWCNVIIERSNAEFWDEMPRPPRYKFHRSIVEGFNVDPKIVEDCHVDNMAAYVNV